MTITKGTNTGLYVKTGAIATDPAPQLNQNITLTNTVDAVACELEFVQYAACSAIRFTVGGVNWINTPLSHGQGIQFAHNVLPPTWTTSHNAWSPTEAGTQRDGTSAVLGTSNNLYRAVSADGKRLIRRTNPAFWGAPYQETVPTRPSLNDRLVSRMTNTIDVNWGWNGDDHIVQWLTDIEVSPLDAAYLATCNEATLIDCSIYANATLIDVAEFLDPANGATRAYPGFPTGSSTEIVMCSSTDGTKAVATYQPLAEWGATGFGQAILTAGPLWNPRIFCIETGAVGSILPGIRRHNPYFIFGTRAQVITSVQALHAANITRSTDIVLPDLAA